MIKENGPEVQIWAKNYHDKCDDQDMVDVFVTHCLIGCTLMTLPWAMYMCMLIKGSLDFDFPTINEDPGFFNKIARLLVLIVCFCVSAVPYLPYYLSGV